MNAGDEFRSGRQDGEVQEARSAGTAHKVARRGDGRRDPMPVLLGSAAPSRRPEPPEEPSAVPARQAPRALEVVAAAPKPVPKGWPAKSTESVWVWMARRRPPMPVIVAGAEGGVGVSTVTALIGEIIAAASPGTTVLVDQCGTGWGSLARRLVGQRAGLPGEVAVRMLREGAHPARVLEATNSTSAGAHLIDDGPGYSPVRELFRLAYNTCGALAVDGGRVDHILAARGAEIGAGVILVGRADVIGAEAVCAALMFLRQRLPIEPVVVLSSTSPTDRRRVQAATKLVATAGVTRLVHLPHDARLADGRPLRLDQVGKTTAATGLQVVAHLGRSQETGHDH